MMASSYEIRQVAAKIKNIYGEIDRRRSKLYHDAKESSFFWKGSGSNAFSQEYEKINNEIKELLDVLEVLERQLKTVAVIIDEREALLNE